MKQVSAYRCDDGKLFEEEDVAAAHQAELDFHAWYPDNKIFSIDSTEALEWLTNNWRTLTPMMEKIVP